MLLFYLFTHHEATLSDFVEYTGINEKTIKVYLNDFVKENLLERLSDKVRDKNAKYVFKK